VQILDPNGYMSFQLGRYAVYFTIPNDDYSYNIYSPTIKDYTSFYFSKTAGNAAKIKYPDGGVFYLHFLENKGENYCYDYSKAIREDSAIDKAVTSYINQLLKAARKLVPKDGKKYYITANSTKLDVIVPSSNNWRLAIGSHQIGFKVECYYDKNNKSYKMYTTLIAYDRYNFDKDTVFVYKNIKINVAWNGRLVEVGLAKFYTSVGIYQFYSIF